MGRKLIPDEEYEAMKLSLATIPTEEEYPCIRCDRPRCSGMKCGEWLLWASDAWPIVTGTLKELDGK